MKETPDHDDPVRGIISGQGVTDAILCDRCTKCVQRVRGRVEQMRAESKRESGAGDRVHDARRPPEWILFGRWSFLLCRPPAFSTEVSDNATRRTTGCCAASTVYLRLVEKGRGRGSRGRGSRSALLPCSRRRHGANNTRSDKSSRAKGRQGHDGRCGRRR